MERLVKKRDALRAGALLLAVVAVAACSKDEKKKGQSGSAQLALANGTPSAALADSGCEPIPGSTQTPDECWTPTMYAMKMLAVYVSPDAEGAHSAPGGLIWANPACPGHTSNSELGVGDEQKTIEYDVLDDCDDAKVTTYFDFARPSETVNAELNSQEKKIPPGTYNYVQLNFCIGGAKTKNLRFQTSDMDAPYDISINQCGAVSAKADPPIVVGEGEAVTVEVTYDLTDVIYASGNLQDPKSCYVSADGGQARCNGSFRRLTPAFHQR
jgi:hypothetical protein